MSKSLTSFNFKYLPRKINTDWINVVHSSNCGFSLEFLIFPKKIVYINLYVLPKRKNKNFLKEDIMKKNRVLYIAYKGLVRNKLNTFLMMIGIIIGVTALTIIVSATQGVKKEVIKSVQKFGNPMEDPFFWKPHG